MTDDNPLDADRGGARSATHGRSRTRSMLEWAAVIIGALVIALPIRTWVVSTYYIPSASMEPTLMVGDRVFVNKIAFDVERGDVVVFDRPGGPGVDGIDVLIKRVIGLEGDVVEARDGVVHRNGEPLEESYLPEGTTTSDFGPLTVQPDQVWVMGDNRTRSQDSRVFGPIPLDSVVGEAFLIFWPLGDLGGL